MTPTQPPPFPPVPRDHASASFSEIIPVGSSKIRLVRSPVTLILVLAGIIAPLTFVLTQTMGRAEGLPDLIRTFTTFAFVTVFFVVFAIGLLVYLYTRPGRSLLVYLWAFACVLLLMVPWVFDLPFILDGFMWLFRDVLGGEPPPETAQSQFWPHFVGHFIGAGMMEELFKAIPILVGLFVGLATRRTPDGMVSPVARFFRIRGPLDGVLMGAFAGAAFIVMETSWQYLPGTMSDVYDDIYREIYRATGDEGSATTGGVAGGLAGALLLYFPRVIGGAVGHMAYSAVFGYFIGLALLRPRQGLFLILGGWLFVSLMHGLWNSAGVIDRNGTAYFIVAGVKAVCFAAVILKARQLHASVHGDGPETMGSIVIDRSRAAPAQAAPYLPPPFPPPFAPPPFQGPPPAQAAKQEQELVLDLAGLLIPIRPGASIDPAGEPALDGQGAGVRGTVVAHPSRPGVLGLRNSGDAIWTAHLRDGRTQQIGRDQNVRLAAGVGVDFGGGLFGRVVPRG